VLCLFPADPHAAAAAAARGATVVARQGHITLHAKQLTAYIFSRRIQASNAFANGNKRYGKFSEKNTSDSNELSDSLHRTRNAFSNLFNSTIELKRIFSRRGCIPTYFSCRNIAEIFLN